MPTTIIGNSVEHFDSRCEENR